MAFLDDWHQVVAQTIRDDAITAVWLFDGDHVQTFPVAPIIGQKLLRDAVDVHGFIRDPIIDDEDGTLLGYVDAAEDLGFLFEPRCPPRPW